MATRAGDVLEIGYSNPDAGSGQFYPKADEDFTLEFGGFINEDDENMIAGNGQRIGKKTRRAPMFEGTIHDDDGAYERVVELRESNEDTTWTITHISGEVFQVTGQPVGENEINKNAGTFTLKVLGNNKMKKIS